MRKLLVFLVTALGLSSHLYASAPTITHQAPLLIAKEFSFWSDILQEQRTVAVSVPKGYYSSDARYSVLYLLDGMQNIYHAAGTHDLLTRTGDMPPTIIVAIKSEDRTRDMTPSADPVTGQGGHASRFLSFLRDELIPFIDENYRTTDFRSLEGHSLGGLFAAYALMEEPSLFDAHVIIAPAFWWNGEEIIKRASTFFPAHKTLEASLYFGIGKNDGNGMRRELGRFVTAIEAASPTGLRWFHQEFSGEGHMSAPLLTLYHGIKFIYQDLQLPQAILENYSDEAFLAHEASAARKYGAAARQSQETYVPLGLKLIAAKNYQGAVTVFERNAEAYADSNYARNYAWLADAYEKNGQIAQALAAFKTAYDLANAIGDSEKTIYETKIKELAAASR